MKKVKKEKRYYVCTITRFILDQSGRTCTYKDIKLLYSVYYNSNKLITLLDFSSDDDYWSSLKWYIGKTLPERIFFKKTCLYHRLSFIDVDERWLDDIDNDSVAKLLFELEYK